MKKKVIFSLCLVVAVTLFAALAWISYLNNATAVGVSVRDIEYRIICREWSDCLGE